MVIFPMPMETSAEVAGRAHPEATNEQGADVATSAGENMAQEQSRQRPGEAVRLAREQSASRMLFVYRPPSAKPAR